MPTRLGRTSQAVGAVVIDRFDAHTPSDECHNLLAGTPAGPANHSHRLHPGQLRDRVLDLGRIDIEAVDDDQLARPVDEQLSVEQVADVSGREPASSSRPPSPSGQ